MIYADVGVRFDLPFLAMYTREKRVKGSFAGATGPKLSLKVIKREYSLALARSTTFHRLFWSKNDHKHPNTAKSPLTIVREPDKLSD